MKVFPMANRTPAAPRSAARRSKAAPAPVSPPLPEPAPEPAIETEVVVETPIAEIEADSAPLPEIKLGKKKDKKKEKKVKKEAVLIRFEDSQLAAIDIQAEALGLSRAAWVRMVVAKALAAG